MAISEVFPNPTVKQVIFQIRFPNLFSIETKIGEFQEKIIDKFPNSSVSFRRQIVFADIGPDAKLEQLPPGVDNNQSTKIWQFKSDKGFNLNILTNSLDITSEYHKTYNNPAANDKFRDIIDYVLKNFFSVVSLPLIKRIGLRYIDECPIIAKNSREFSKWYKTTFPLDRFKIEDATEMNFLANVKKDKYFIRYVEAFSQIQESKVYKLILDFDGYAMDIDSKECLKTTDALHTLISDEYEKTIKAPVYKYMRQKKGKREK